MNSELREIFETHIKLTETSADMMAIYCERLLRERNWSQLAEYAAVTAKNMSRAAAMRKQLEEDDHAD